jgi:hypothetical protein
MDEHTRRNGCMCIRYQDRRCPLNLTALTRPRDVVKPPCYGAPSRRTRSGERLAYGTAPHVSLSGVSRGWGVSVQPWKRYAYAPRRGPKWGGEG